MLNESQFPILEFDPNRTAKIHPSIRNKKQDVPKACVITFFGDIVQAYFDKGLLRQIAVFETSFVRLPVYETIVDNERVGLVKGFWGAAGSARQLEDLIAMGFEKFIVCGAAGVLRSDIAVGHLVLPIAAVRDEGVSYHYIAPSREIECNEHAVSVIEAKLKTDHIPYVKAKTWTTDVVYRETEDKIALRRSEGCVTVEQEAAALFAVSKFRDVILGQILYSGDDVSGKTWDSRKWRTKENSRAALVDLCFEVALLL